MEAPARMTLGGKDFARLREARLQAHYAAQWLARAARAYLAPQDDDSHTNLGWNDYSKALATHSIGAWRLALKVSPFALAMVDDGASPPTLASLAGLNDKAVREWLGNEVAARGLDASRLDLPAPYDLPQHAIAEGGRYGGDLEDAFADLAEWFAVGERAISTVRADLVARGLAAPEPRCWPHHFDLATLTSFAGAAGLTAYVGAGLSPGDTFYEEPYFYVSLYPRPPIAGLAALPPIGHWHDKEFTGAVAPASKIVAAEDPEGAIELFLAIAVDAAIGRLTAGA